MDRLDAESGRLPTGHGRVEDRPVHESPVVVGGHAIGRARLGSLSRDDDLALETGRE